MKNPPPFDLKPLLQRCLQDGAFVRELLSTFQSQARRELPLLLDAVRQANLPQIVAISHKLKGSAANVSAEKLCRLCDDLEEAAKSGVFAEFPAQAASIAEEISRCETSLPAILDSVQ